MKKTREFNELIDAAGIQFFMKDNTIVDFRFKEPGGYLRFLAFKNKNPGKLYYSEFPEEGAVNLSQIKAHRTICWRSEETGEPINSTDYPELFAIK